MAMRALFSCIFLISLLVAVITGESKNHIVYQKLEDAVWDARSIFPIERVISRCGLPSCMCGSWECTTWKLWQLFFDWWTE